MSVPTRRSSLVLTECFPTLSSLLTIVNRFPLSLLHHTIFPITKHNIIFLRADSSPTVISDNPEMCQQSSHLLHHYFFYTLLPVWEEQSVKKKNTQCTVKPWSVSELHRHCNTRNTEISHAAIQMLECVLQIQN